MDNTKFIGMTEERAKKVARNKDLLTRVIERDGVGKIHTMEFRSNRVNFIVKDGIVIDVRVG